MTEPTITCPKCNVEIKLTESLAAPLVAKVREDYEARLAEEKSKLSVRETSLDEREKAILAAQQSVDARVAELVAEQRAVITAEEARKARQSLQLSIDEGAATIEELRNLLEDRDRRLTEAQKEQAAMLRQRRELDDEKRELDLTVEKRIQEGLESVRVQARSQAEEELKSKFQEKEHTITMMRSQIEELKKRAEQGSQQLQGEVQELELEAVLATGFPRDFIEPVPKGEHGGDVLHRVMNTAGQVCGTILWESKNTKNWSDGWLVKVREDQRAAKAEVAVIVTQALPKGVETCDLVDGVWVTHPRFSMAIALILRQSLLEIAGARLATVGQQSKMETVYEYLTGPRFRQRVEAIVEAFSTMKDDLERERKAITKQWAKRDEQITRVMEATVGMYGDLQGIAGRSLVEIEGISLPELEAYEEEVVDVGERS